MATLYSDIITNLRASPVVKPDSGQSNGKVRCDVFSWTGDAAQNDLVELVRLPVGARIMTAVVNYTAFGASVTLDVGDSTTENKYLSALSVAAAGTSDFANTNALYGVGRERLSTSVTVIAKFEGANPASGSLYGYIFYTVE
jgi:hypothetical protein